MTTFSWLHLTDLHLGMGEQVSLLPVIKNRFIEDLKVLHDKCGPWDMVLITGDLTQRGSAEEFQKVDQFLGELWVELNQLGSTSVALAAVPGNHDLARPSAKKAEVKVLHNWMSEPDVRSDFWKEPQSTYRETITTAFANYAEWWKNTPFKLPAQTGILPGDFSAVLEKEGASLGIVGLNSTFLQLTEGEYQGKLSLDPHQFHAVCDADGPQWVKKRDACLLLTHHPPDWLTPESREEFEAEIAGYNFFAVHLFGHRHEARYVSQAKGGAAALRTFQGASVFGLEHFGDEKKLERSHGYAAGKIEILGEKGSLILWPRQASQPGGQWNFAAASGDFVLIEDHIAPQEFPLSKRIQQQQQPPPASVDAPEPEAPAVPRPFPNQWAVLVGVNDYQDITKLRFCRQDVIELATAFRESLGFQKVFEFHEESELKPERDIIFRKLGDIRDSGEVRPGDLFVFYFSGHGVNFGGKDYLLPIGARPRDAKTLGIRVQDLAEALKEIKCENTAMFIDACREAVEGGAADGAKGTASIGEESSGLVAQAGIVAFFSCDPKDRSYEIEDLEHGSFTYCVLQAIREGSITTVSELDSYLRENVPQINTRYNKPAQQPYAVKAERGDLEIFFNPHHLRKTALKFEPMIDQLIVLVGDGKDVLGALEFLDQIKAKKQLDETEKMKMQLIESVCEGRLTPETFSRIWTRLGEARRPAGPQIKKLPRLA